MSKSCTFWYKLQYMCDHQGMGVVLHLTVLSHAVNRPSPAWVDQALFAHPRSSRPCSIKIEGWTKCRLQEPRPSSCTLYVNIFPRSSHQLTKILCWVLVPEHPVTCHTECQARPAQQLLVQSGSRRSSMRQQGAHLWHCWRSPARAKPCTKAAVAAVLGKATR